MRSQGRKPKRPLPYYDAKTGNLWVGKTLVKHITKAAKNQRLILESFQEQRWRRCIDDPLPQGGIVNPMRRLHSVIRDLRHNMLADLIHFGGDGTGKGIRWYYADEWKKH